MNIMSLVETCNPAPLAVFARSRAPGEAITAPVRTRAWHPGAMQDERHGEIFAACDEASGAALALALARQAWAAAGRSACTQNDRRQVLWVQDRAAVKLTGRPYVQGLPPELRHRLIHVEAGTPEDTLFALEEGLRCRELAFVLGEIAGNPRALTFTASRRLSLAAERHGAVLWLVRLDAQPGLSSARMRWKVASAPSPPARWDAAAPGPSAWRAELFRARSYPPGEWILSDGGSGLIAGRSSSSAEGAAAPGHGGLARAAGARSLAAF